MYVSVIIILSIIINVSDLSDCVTVNRISSTQGIVSKTRIALDPLEITCGLNDILTISAPIVNDEEKHYYLTNPKGETTKLSLKYNNLLKKGNKVEKYDNSLKIKYIIQRNESFIGLEKPFNVFNVNRGIILSSAKRNLISDNENDMNDNNFMIGPLSEDNYGNWVLSLYVKDVDNEWIEMFQVITVNIEDLVPMNVRSLHLHVGDTFNLSFAYPIKYLESCELIAPSTTFDRHYERDIRRKDMTNCEFIIKNVTQEDEGFWRIVGVGKIVYKAISYLKVQKENKRL